MSETFARDPATGVYLLSRRTRPEDAPTTEAGYTVEKASFWDVPDDEKVPELQWPNSIEILDQMRTQEPQVVSVLRAVITPLLRTACYVDPAGARDEVTENVSRNMGLPIRGADPVPAPRLRDRFSWSEHLQLALTCLPFGHAYFEQVYRVGPDERGVQRAWIRKLAWRPPRTITRVEVATDGGLVAIEQGAKHRMEVGRVVAYVHGREGGNWLGQSMLRPAYKFWVLKDRMLRVQAQTLDRNGMGVPVYEAPEIPKDVYDQDEHRKLQDQEIAQGLKIARALRSGRNAAAAIPHSAKLEMKGVVGELPDAEKVIRYYDEQIARSVLAHFLNLGTETGSWALGSTFADFFTLSLQSIALMIADVGSKHIVEDLVDLNFGPDEPAPRLVFDEVGRHLDWSAIAALIKAGGLELSAELRKFLAQALGLPVSTISAAPSGAPSGGSAAERARFAAETAQKVYLATDKVPLRQDEARELIRLAGADLTGAGPDIEGNGTA